MLRGRNCSLLAEHLFVALLTWNESRCQRLDVSLCTNGYLFDVSITSSTGSAPRQHVRDHVVSVGYVTARTHVEHPTRPCWHNRTPFAAETSTGPSESRSGLSASRGFTEANDVIQWRMSQCHSRLYFKCLGGHTPCPEKKRTGYYLAKFTLWAWWLPFYRNPV